MKAEAEFLVRNSVALAFRKATEVNCLSLIRRGRPRPICTPDDLLASGCDLRRRDAKSGDVDVEAGFPMQSTVLRDQADTANLDALDPALGVFTIRLVYVRCRDGGVPAAIEENMEPLCDSA